MAASKTHSTIPKTGFVKPLSRAMRVHLATDCVRVDNWCLTEEQPSGGLRNFLSAQYRDVAAMDDMFERAGGSIICRATYGTEPTVVAFGMDEAGRPTMLFKGQRPDTVVEVRLFLAESPTHAANRPLSPSPVAA